MICGSVASRDEVSDRTVFAVVEFRSSGVSKVGIRRWIQPVDATRSLNISAGVWKPSVLRGLWFNCRAIAFS